MIVAVPSALAGPTRLDAVRLLIEGLEHRVCEVMRTFGASQSRMSRHMQVLKQAGRVVEGSNAQLVRYRLRPGLPDYLKTVVAADLVGEVIM